MGGDDNKTYQQPDAKETQRFWTKIIATKKHNKKGEWISNITRGLEELEEGPKAEIHTDLLKTTLKKYQTGKRQAMMEYMISGSRLALEMNKCLRRAHVPEWMTKGRSTLIQENPNKGTTSNNYRLITCLAMMWKILTAQITEEIYYSLTSRGLFHDEQKGCCKGSRSTTELLYIDQHILNESKTRRKKSSYGLNWLQKGIWYGSAELDNKRPQNVQNITWSHKPYYQNHENLERELTAGGRS